MKTHSRFVLPLAGSIAFLLTPAQAVDIVKANNATALDQTASWTGGVVPTAADVAVWDGTSLAAGALASQPQLGADASWLGIRIANPPGTANAATTFVGIQNTGSANTLTLGSSGIDMSAATHALRIDARVTLGASQTWAVANANTSNNPTGFNNGEDLGFQANALVPFNLGGNTVTTSGAGQITITSGYTVNNGTINVGNNLFIIQGGGNRLTTVNSNVTMNVASGSILHFQSNSGAITSNGNITLNGGTLKLVSNNGTNLVTLTGTTHVAAASTLNLGNNFAGGSTANATGVLFNANLTGSAALAVTINSGAVTPLVFGGDNSGYSGTIAYTGTAGRVLRLNTATAGSAAATWNVGTGVVLQTNGVSVNLGTLDGAGTVNNNAGTGTINVGAGNFSGTIVNGTGTLGLTKQGAGTLTLSGANTYTGPTAVNNGTLLTTPLQTGATNISVADGATFGVNLLTAGTTFNTPSLTVGTATGGRVQFGTGSLGNPTAPLINATSFNPVAGTIFRVTGTALSPAVGIPLLSYTGTIGGGGFAGLSLQLPFRVTGNLVDNSGASRVDLNIAGTAVPVWRGTINGNWDIDNVGDGSVGTANWFATSGPNTYVQGAPVGTDAVVFDDTVGAGPTTVNLTATLTPTNITVNNTLVNYTFTGAGKLSGSTGITKSGNGTLTLANTTANDYAGTTTINGGKIRVGDGVTSGAGSLGGGAVSIGTGATLEYDRPDNLSLALNVSGTGTLRKANSNTLTLTNAQTHALNLEIAGGTLAFSGGGTLSGVISGGGGLTSTAGTLQLAGSTANTYSGLTTVSAGLLQLNKAPNTNAVGGNILLSGTAQMAWLAAEQVPDSATITVTSTSTDSITTQSGETIANAILNSANPGAAGGQIILRNNTTITGTATVQSGVFGVASGNTGTINHVNITAAPGSAGILRVAGNSAASTLNIGAGGITASGGEIQVKFNTNDQDAVLNLAGDFTTTGNVAVTNAGYTGPNLNVINLNALTNTFNIGAGTTTTVAPDLGGTGALAKTGNGTLTLTTLSNAAHAGATTVSAGRLLVHGSVSGTSGVNVTGGTLGGNGTVSAPVLIGSGGNLLGGDGVAAADDLAINGDLTMGLGANIQLALGSALAHSSLTRLGGTWSFQPTQAFNFIDAGAVLGTYDNIISGLAADPIVAGWTITNPGWVGTFFYDGAGGVDLNLVAVPEPGSAAVLLVALGLLGLRRRRG